MVREGILAVMGAVNGLAVVVQEVELAMDTRPQEAVILTQAVVVVLVRTLREHFGEIMAEVAHHPLGQVEREGREATQ